MIPIFAIGNAGLECKTTRLSADYPNVVAVGSTTSGDNLLSFSGKGPSVDGLVKPDITAPGTSITSAWYMGVNSYATASGTSQAAPMSLASWPHVECASRLDVRRRQVGFA